MLVAALLGLLLLVSLAVLLVARASASGTRERRVPPAYDEPGRCTVVLGDVGPRRSQTIEAVREVTDVDAAQARDWADATPCAIAGGLSPASAERVRTRLEQAGATAWVEGWGQDLDGDR